MDRKIFFEDQAKVECAKLGIPLKLTEQYARACLDEFARVNAVLDGRPQL